MGNGLSIEQLVPFVALAQLQNEMAEKPMKPREALQKLSVYIAQYEHAYQTIKNNEGFHDGRK